MSQRKIFITSIENLLYILSIPINIFLFDIPRKGSQQFIYKMFYKKLQRNIYNLE